MARNILKNLILLYFYVILEASDILCDEEKQK